MRRCTLYGRMPFARKLLFNEHFPFSLFNRLKLECEKLTNDKTEMQRHYVMVSVQRFFVSFILVVGCNNHFILLMGSFLSVNNKQQMDWGDVLIHQGAKWRNFVCWNEARRMESIEKERATERAREGNAKRINVDYARRIWIEMELVLPFTGHALWAAAPYTLRMDMVNC